jgi:hypothetical protein
MANTFDVAAQNYSKEATAEHKNGDDDVHSMGADLSNFAHDCARLGHARVREASAKVGVVGQEIGSAAVSNLQAFGRGADRVTQGASLLLRGVGDAANAVKHEIDTENPELKQDFRTLADMPSQAEDRIGSFIRTRPLTAAFEAPFPPALLIDGLVRGGIAGANDKTSQSTKVTDDKAATTSKSTAAEISADKQNASSAAIRTIDKPVISDDQGASNTDIASPEIKHHSTVNNAVVKHAKDAVADGGPQANPNSLKPSDKSSPAATSITSSYEALDLDVRKYDPQTNTAGIPESPPTWMQKAYSSKRGAASNW